MSFTVYKSSAGSGKTFTLVKEYLKIVLVKPSDFRLILAITFTNKAANEMKERVISNLRELSSSKPDINSTTIKFLLPDLLIETKLSVEDLKKNATKALALILHNYSDFAIGTIDSFIHKIIKTFAYDLHLPLNFEVELDANKILKQAVEILISKVGLDQELTNILLSFTAAKIQDESDWNIENDLLKLSKALLNEDSEPRLESLRTLTYQDYQQIIKSLNEFIKNFRSSINKQAKEANDLILSHNISYKSFYYGASGIGKYFERLATPLNENFEAKSRVMTTINEGKWKAGKISDSESQAIDDIKGNLEEYFFKIETIKEAQWKKYKLFKILHKQIYAIAVLGEVEKIIEDFKTTNNLIHISEFNKRVSEVVLSEPIPFIYERLGEKYKNFLIDEFQDTSVLQWQNLLPLIDNSLAENNFNMIVGDGKQAIYRWRGGEVEQFSSLPKLLQKDQLPFAEEREANLERNYNEKVLNRNFRSKREIIEFNNGFFGQISQLLSDHLKPIYKFQEQEFDPQNTGGYVELNFLQKDNESETDEMLVQTKTTIDRLIEADYHYQDITVLCRTNREASKIANHLMELEIPVLSSESLLLSASAKLNLLVAIIKYLLNPIDKINNAHIIQLLIEIDWVSASFHECLSALNEPQKEHADLVENSVESGFKIWLEEHNIELNVHQLKALPIYDLCEALIRKFNFQQQADPYLQFFLDVALKTTIDGNSNISDFIEWWNDNKEKESVIIPEGLDAINIMTIHKSKGLEFPIVIFPYANSVVKQTLNNVWVDVAEPEIEMLKSAFIPLSKANLENTIHEALFDNEYDKSYLDMLNIIYVAFTRAANQLYVLANIPSPKAKDIKSIPSMLKHFLIQKDLWEDEKLQYDFGSFMPCIQKQEVQSNFVPLSIFNSVDWRKNLLISTSAPEVWDVNDPERNKEWGNLIHYIFSKIEYHNQYPEAIAQLVENGIILKEQEQKFTDYVQSVISLAEIAPYFKEGLNVKNEADILLANGQSIRPDRIIFEKNKTIILDYKTGKPEQSHHLQIKKYGAVLKEMGYPSIELKLVYLNKKVRLVDVDY